MRLIGTLYNLKQAQRFSAFLASKGVENQIELMQESDWGSDHYGDEMVRIWVFEEDQFTESMQWLEEFYQNPNDPRYTQLKISKESVIPDEPHEEYEMYLQKERNEPTNYLTLYILVTCILLFAVSLMTTPKYEPISVNYPPTAIYSSEVTQGLLFDFPKAYQIIATIVDVYGIEALQNPGSMPPEGQLLLSQFQDTPYWQGYYEEFVLWMKGKPAELWEHKAPLFEKIREGEVWRLFTPCLLHLDILHLFFNMLWLVILGRQIEQRLQTFRYVIFILIAGIIANIAQYLVSGANFIGFSGVLCAMFTFIWMRQQRAAWEGYQLHRSTIILIGIFISAMFLIQVASFVAEVYSGKAVAPLIANTAHLTGAAVGFILGRMNFFAWKQ